MRVVHVLAACAAMGAVGCPPLGDDYEVVSAGDAAHDASAEHSGGTGAVGGSDGAAGSGGSLGGAGGDSSAEGGCSACDATCCAGSCVNLELDTANCGACDNACAANRACNFGKCSSGWIAMSPPPPGFSARIKAAQAWTGTALFIWGGADASGAELDSGALYDPIADTWELVPNGPNTPSGRVLATALATSAGIIVWGGGDNAGTVDYADGALYRPQLKSWTKLVTAPGARRAPIGVWTGASALFWGGWDKAGAPVQGSVLFDPALGWSAASAVGDPGALSDAAWAFSKDALYLCGGQLAGAEVDTCFSEALSDGSWSALPKGVSARYGAFGAWDGSRFWVWGGRDATNAKQDGMSFDGSVWANITPTSGTPPAARWQSQRRAGWSVSTSKDVVLVLGGLSVNPDSVLMDGAVYDASGAWTSVPSWPSGQAHEFGVGIWTGAEMIVWGGQSGSSLSLKGERFAP